jgi:hypothetical protein
MLLAFLFKNSAQNDLSLFSKVFVFWAFEHLLKITINKTISKNGTERYKTGCARKVVLLLLSI